MDIASYSSEYKKAADSTVHPEYKFRNSKGEILKLFDEIDNCTNAIEILQEQANEEVLRIEKIFNNLRKPYFTKRAEIINTIPHFWITAFMNHPDLSFLLKDGAHFHYLTKIEVEENEHPIKSGYKIHFFFEENPYFENAVLTKEFKLGSLDEFTSFSIPLKWKAGMDISGENVPSCSYSNLSTRKLDHRPFFIWYNNHLNPRSDIIAEKIKKDLWSNPLQYYVNFGVIADDWVDLKSNEATDEEKDN